MRKRKTVKLEKLSNEFQRLYIDEEKKQEYMKMAKFNLENFLTGCCFLGESYFLNEIERCHEQGLYGKQAEEYLNSNINGSFQDIRKMMVVGEQKFTDL
jgi:hypothetical protein